MTSLTTTQPAPLVPKQTKTVSTQDPPHSPRLPTTTPSASRRPPHTPSSAHPIAPHAQFGGNSLALAFGGIRPPQNTPAENMVPISASRIQGPRRFIGGATRSGIGIGGGVGRGSPSHPITPGNTPSSLEKITRRIAGTLSLSINEESREDFHGNGGLGQNRIAPSYDQKLQQPGTNRFHPPSPPSNTATRGTSPPGSGKGGFECQWPQSFGNVSDIASYRTARPPRVVEE